jgi:hypothetical protein
MKDTLEKVNAIIQKCKNIFIKKNKEYGLSWTILRANSIIDQIFIKCIRIRNIEKIGFQKVKDNILEDFIAIINYSVIAIIQQNISNNNQIINLNDILPYYDNELNISKKIIENKNHDYKECWKEIKISSLVDFILQKLLRIKQLTKNKIKNYQDIYSQYIDIINYSIFSLIKIYNQNKKNEKKNSDSKLENE